MNWLYLTVFLFTGAGLNGAQAQDERGYISGDCWWCNDDDETDVDDDETASITEYYEDDYDDDVTTCECVPWYLCGNNAIITDGAGLLDLRTIPVKNVKECPDPMHTCCGIPIDTGIEEPHEPNAPTKLPPSTPCDCTSYRQCPERLIVNDGQGETCLNVARSASSHSRCPHVTDVCCANATESDIAIAAALVSELNDNSVLEDCECVEEDMCDTYGYIKPNYQRSYGQPAGSNPQSEKACSNLGLVCCRPRVECECVNQDQCGKDGYVITDGATLINIRTIGSNSQTQGRCNDPCQVCCKIPEEPNHKNPNNFSIDPIYSTTTERTGQHTEEPNSTPLPLPERECHCVEKSQCGSYKPDYPDYNYGGGLLDARIIDCDNPNHVCCDTPIVPPTENNTTPTSITTPSPISDCGKRNRQGTLNLRIMGFRDDQSQFGEFPWVATVLREELIMNKPHHLFVGGGSLIHPRVVLTAAHKIHTLSSNKLHIRLGEWDTQTVKEPLEHQDLEVESVIIHPNFDKNNLRFDVGLIFLKEEAKINSHIQKICLAEDLSEVDQYDCVINGWGKDGFANDGQYQKIMKSVGLPLVRSDTCQSQLRGTRLGRYFRLHKSFLCAGGEAGQDSCKGDGGGPLACVRRGGDKDDYLLVGITAWGIGCGDEGVPGVYVNVPFHFDWIKEQIEAVHPSTIAPSTTPATEQDCPSDCSSEFDPLCGSNGRTYGNDCELRMANCHDPTILFKHQGECVKANQKAKFQKKKKERELKKKKRRQERQQMREGNE